MSLDSVTETIAHFVGTFNLTIEQARLRDQYEEFTGLRRKVELEELQDPTTIRIKADLDDAPGDYDPLSMRFTAPPAEPGLPPALDGPALQSFISVGPPFLLQIQVPEAEQVISVEQTLIILQPQIVTEIIGSAVTYTFQTLFLRDNDTVGQGDFRDVDALMAQAESLLDVATSLHALSAPSLDISDYLSVEYVEALAAEMQAPMTAQLDGVTIHQFHGDDAIGTIVNGQHVDEAPEWSDLLPAYHQPDEVEEGEEPDFTPAEWDQDKESEFADGHTVVTGGNLAVNEVAMTVAWVDAPFIAVGGQAISLTMISQVAVVSDHDQGNPGTGSGTEVVQSAEIKTEANAPHWLDDTGTANGQPTDIQIDWIDGDLIVSNIIQQVIDATDIDQIQADITAATTLYTMGANQLVNVTDIVQLGSYYDLIMVGGDMISVDMLFQTLVLVDDDVVTGGMPGPVDGADDNLLMNQASLTTLGEDIEAEVDQNIADAMSMAAADMDALEDALLNDPMFAGMEQMRVLKIDGDLLQLNIVDQVTMLADQDDVDLSGPNAAVTEVMAGSNAMLNAANITKAGVDSQVMAANGTYSDLLLHQASLIDAPEPNGTDMANEAIALLMEDMNTPGVQPGADPAGSDLTPTETMSSSDGLQSMLA
ncbi:type I secretion protein [Ruegeria sp.]|uniref:type I secretion protein n=1 Tax=Ruegeria sp. TaxID=1879320 RepID=UPI00231B825B|nr:type I secretion protein [Ruegeria sp.]MDA7965653.1 type I secretion protein [Ruegeria sp.]